MNKRFIVFELDNIKDNKVLFPIVTIIIMETFINKMRRLKGIRMEVVQRAGGGGRTGIIFTYGKMTFSGGQIDRSLTYNRINQAMAAIGQADAADVSMHMHGQTAAPFDGQSVSSPLVGIDGNEAGATAQAENTLPDGADSSTIGSNIGEAAVEIIMQPQHR